MQGQIVRLVQDRGFGFIAAASDSSGAGEEYFFHLTGCVTPFDSLTVGQAVTFDLEDSQKGPRACSVVAQ